MSRGAEWATVAGAAIFVGIFLSLFPRAGGWLLLVVVLTMVLVAGERGLWDAPGTFTFQGSSHAIL